MNYLTLVFFLFMQAIQVKGNIMIKMPEDWEKGLYFRAGTSSGLSPAPDNKDSPLAHQYDKITDWATRNALYSSIISSSFSNSFVGDLLDQSTASNFEDECQISFSHPVCFSDIDEWSIVGNRRQSVVDGTQFCSEKSESVIVYWDTWGIVGLKCSRCLQNIAID